MKCAKCQEIIEKQERYVRITDFNKGEQEKEIFLHLNCWKNMYRDKINKELKEKVKKVMGMIQR